MRWPCIEGHAKTRLTLSISFPRQFLFLGVALRNLGEVHLSVNRIKIECRGDLRRADDCEAFRGVLDAQCGCGLLLTADFGVEFRVARAARELCFERQRDGQPGRWNNRLIRRIESRELGYPAAKYEAPSESRTFVMYTYNELC
jgi:hypothetical protein